MRSSRSSSVTPDVVFTHRRDDEHQDHRTIAELTWNTFRNHLIAEYEIPKYEGDLGHPNLFVPLDAASSPNARSTCSMKHFGSQRSQALVPAARRFSAAMHGDVARRRSAVTLARVVARAEGVPRVDNCCDVADGRPARSSSGRNDMKVLVTGHLGYIGAEMVPVLLDHGHDVVGLDTGFYDECDFAARPTTVDELRVDLRDVTPQHLEGFDAVLHLAALSNDPLGDLNPNLTYDINLRRLGPAGRGGQRGGRRSASCSRPRAACTAPAATTSSTRPPSSTRSRRTASRRCASSRRSSELADDVVLARLPAQRDRVRRVAPPASRHRRQQPRRPRRDHRQGPPAERRHAVASARPHPRHHRRVRGVPRARRAIAIHNQAFNVGRTGENYQIRDVANIVAEVVPDCEVTFADGASADNRDYQVDFTKIETKLPYAPSWSLRPGIEELYQSFVAAGMDTEAWNGNKYYRLRTIRSLLDRHGLNEDLRWV